MSIKLKYGKTKMSLKLKWLKKFNMKKTEKTENNNKEEKYWRDLKKENNGKMKIMKN